MYTIHCFERYISIWNVYFEQQHTTDTVFVTLQLAETI